MRVTDATAQRHDTALPDGAGECTDRARSCLLGLLDSRLGLFDNRFGLFDSLWCVLDSLDACDRDMNG